MGHDESIIEATHASQPFQTGDETPEPKTSESPDNPTVAKTTAHKLCREYMSKPPLGEMMKDVAAAEFLGVCPATMRSWRCRGIGPSYVKYGCGSKAAVRYRRRDLEQFIEQARQMPSVRKA